MNRLLDAFIILILIVLSALGYLLRTDAFWLLILFSYAVIILLMRYFIYRLRLQDKGLIKRLENRIDTKNKQIRQKKEIASHILYYHSVGVMILEDDYTVIYANKNASDLFPTALEGKQLELLDEHLYQSVRFHPETRPIVTIAAKQFEISYIQSRHTIYLNPVTERELLRQKNRDETPALGYFRFDQFEETLDVLDRPDRNQLVNDVIKVIEKWAAQYHFEVIPLSERLVMFIGYRKEMKMAMEEGFTFLKSFSGIGKDKDIIITISGGIAMAQISFDELSTVADQALESASSRGGDQIIINEEGETLKYYGDNPQTQEKRTRISARIHAQKIARIMSNVDRVYVAPHQYPDADAIGAALGVYKMAKALDKEAYILVDVKDISPSVLKIIDLMKTEIPYQNMFIPVHTALNQSSKNSLVVLVDHHSEGQLVSTALLKQFEQYVIIDHHRKLDDALQNPLFFYLEPFASSTTELVVEMIKVFQPSVSVTSLEATLMLAGIIVDTNNFMYRTGSRTYEAAAYLRTHGADSIKVKNLLRESFDEIKLKAQLLTLADVILGRFSIVVAPEDFKLDRILLAKISDAQLEIDHIEASFTIGFLSDGTIGISARSMDRFNVQDLMEQMGGGGHLNNAATQIQNSTLDKVKAELIEKLERLEQEGEKMKVILLKDLKNKGKKDDVIEVAAGYGHFLISSQIAVEANETNIEKLNQAQAVKEEEDLKALIQAKTLKGQIDYRAVKLPVKMGDKGKLYAKVNTKMVADALSTQHDIDVDKRKIVLPDKIDQIGTYSISIKLHKDVTATFELVVIEE
jgi:ribosomal protein L9